MYWILAGHKHIKESNSLKELIKYASELIARGQYTEAELVIGSDAKPIILFRKGDRWFMRAIGGNHKNVIVDKDDPTKMSAWVASKSPFR